LRGVERERELGQGRSAGGFDLRTHDELIARLHHEAAAVAAGILE